MIHPYEITIGSLLRTSKGEIIRVESISTKRGHRKVGYHRANEPCRIKYVRLAQCEGIELTPEILEINGFDEYDGSVIGLPNFYSNRNDRDNKVDVCFCTDEGLKEVSITLYARGYDHICFEHLDHICIHEFQQYLRCAGLHELANEIKI